MRLIEAVVLVLIATIGSATTSRSSSCRRPGPTFPEMARWLFAPDLPAFFRNKDLVYLAIGIIGATVMPHNLYLHSALVQTRKMKGTGVGSPGRALQHDRHDGRALGRVLRQRGDPGPGRGGVLRPRQGHAPLGPGDRLQPDSDWIQVAYVTLAPLVGKVAASLLFAVALLASGQSSTITGTLAGQVVMEGFMHWRIPPGCGA
jgi:manganese transport protein